MDGLANNLSNYAYTVAYITISVQAHVARHRVGGTGAYWWFLELVRVHGLNKIDVLIGTVLDVTPDPVDEAVRHTAAALGTVEHLVTAQTLWLRATCRCQQPHLARKYQNE